MKATQKSRQVFFLTFRLAEKLEALWLTAQKRQFHEKAIKSENIVAEWQDTHTRKLL